MSSVIGAIGAMFTKYMVTPPSQTDYYVGLFDSFGRWETRRIRYDFFWAHYSNTQYDQGQGAHLWAAQFKTLYALYKYTRGAYNPLYRLGEFWATTTWGGKLDPAKQGGKVVQSALPIITDNENIRTGLGKLWTDSQWAVNKDLVPLHGSVKGDVGIKVVDDPDTGQMRIVPVDPSTIRWLLLDPMGNVLAYELWQQRWDPRYDPKTMDPRSPGAGQQAVTYIERAYMDGQDCVFETMLNYEPYGWYGKPATWREPYGFIPFVFIPHVKKIPEYYWGWSEFQAALTKAHEADDVASIQHDYIRKAANCRWFFSGVQKPATTPKLQGDAASMTDTAPGREEGQAIYGGQNSDVKAMIPTFDLQFSSQEIMNMVTSLEKDYPELRYDSARATGDASAKALREVRKAAEVKVHSRRAGYDAQLCRAQAMALAIGGMRGYPNYDGMGLEMYQAGELHHTIGERSVFLMDPLDRIEEDQAFYMSFQTAKSAEIPDQIILERADWTKAEITHFQECKQKEADTAIANAKAAMPPEPAVKAPKGVPAPTNAA